MASLNRRQSIGNILSGLNPFNSEVRRDLVKGFKDDYGIGKEDTTRTYYRQRDLENATDEAPKMTNMVNTHTGVTRTKEALGMTSPEQRQSLQENDMALRGSLAHKVGQFGGTAANDLTQDRSRSIYWLLNALQATGEVVNESVLSKVAPSLYSATAVAHPTINRNLRMGNKRDEAYMLREGILKNIDGKNKPARGYKTKDVAGGTEVLKRNYSPGMVQSLAIPTGIAINSGLGLLTPFGGAEGYKAALPSEEDPTKTSNVLGEVGLKYVMGRTGQLLPYSDFNQVRPDVSRDEYERYQAFKYDKREDWNPADGDITIAGGAIKATDEGIHGPELQFLGRSLPVTTGMVPYVGALAGGAVGARMGVPNKRAAISGLIGGMGGLAVGQLTGHALEAERRRRNANENLQEGTF